MHSLVFLTGIVITIIACTLSAILPGMREQIDHAFFDRMAVQFVRSYQSTPVRIVDIDDRSLARLGQWPWARDRVAALTKRLTDAGVAAIAFDILFSEPDRTSPSRLIATLPQPARAALSGLPDLDHDALFAEALRDSPSVLPIGLVGRPTETHLLKQMPVAVIGSDVLASAPHYAGAIGSLPMLQAAAPGLATFSFVGTDRTVRAVPLVSVFDGQIVPSLSLEALRLASGGGTIAIKRRIINGEPRLAIRVGGRTIEADTDGLLRLHYAGHVPARFISAADLMEDPISPTVLDQLSGAIVLIGTSAVGLSDLRPTPVDPYLPGVEIHAEAIEHMLLGLAVERPDWIVEAEIAAMLAVGLIVTLIAGVWGGARALAVVVVLTVAGVAIAVEAFTRDNLQIDPLPAIATGLGVAVIVAFLRHAVVDRNGRWLKQAFAQYLSPELVDRLARNPQAVSLGGETRDITCLFTDLEGFTRLSEHLAPPDLVLVMNAYLDGLCQVAKANGGTVLKIIGDSVHVIFNAPMDQPDHPARAIACAAAMHAFAKRFQVEQAESGRTVGRTRIGIATGPAVVGNFGGTTRFDYTAYGDTINIAARLEAANKGLGTLILMTSATAEAAAADVSGGTHLLRPVGDIAVAGKSEPVAAFELVTGEGVDVDCMVFLAALAALARDDGTGHAAMAAYVEAYPNDPVARLMLNRLDTVEAAA